MIEKLQELKEKLEKMKSRYSEIRGYF